MSRSQTAVIIPAAGIGERLGIGIPKALAEISGTTLIEHALGNIREVAEVIVIAAAVGYESEFRKLLNDSSVKIVAGGALRSQSVANALRVLPENTKYVLVHDAARAFAPKGLAERVLSELRAGEKAVVPALNVVDTIKVVDSSGYVVATPDRANLRAMQTPQGFTVDVIKRAHESGGDATDDAALVSQLGIAVKVIPGSPRARKITTVEDLAWARELVSHP
jgi:2-C-methyl-D-erythritol 4-phosphate cytidylyltransferase